MSDGHGVPSDFLASGHLNSAIRHLGVDLIGTSIGVYHITALLGVGGMGEVYRARDTKLNREVALKVLPFAVAHDSDRLRRFEREAKIVASLNHPNIAIIHGLEQAGDVHALVMELVEGEDLSQRLAHGAMPLQDALPIAKQICEALETAHEHGIIHRDLKPANIKVTDDGTVKVLDFGLAKAMEPAEAPSDASLSPTITRPVTTQAGIILGTAAYMSPEQAQGKPADKRADIWGLGCLLYEMLTSRRAFEGEGVAETLASIITREPNWNALPADVPAAIRTLIQRCLAKDRRQRVSDVSTALYVIDEAASFASRSDAALSGIRGRSLWRRVAVSIGMALFGAVVAGTFVWLAVRRQPSHVSRFTITLPNAAALTAEPGGRSLVIAPDGLRLFYVGSNSTRVFVRSVDSFDATQIFRGTTLRGLFVSPDGQWVGFSELNNVLKKVSATGGPPTIIASLDGPDRGATWAPDETIIFATANTTTGLQRVRAGGTPIVLTKPDRARGEEDHFWPEMLPGGQAVLFTITAQNGDIDAAQVAALELTTMTQRVVVRGGSHAHYVGGYLVYAAKGGLRAIAFDPSRLETSGLSTAVVPQIRMFLAGGAQATFASNGTAMYLTGGGLAQRELEWIDRRGQETPLALPPGLYDYPRIAPDGSRLAVVIRPAGSGSTSLWLSDLVHPSLRPFVVKAGAIYPVWTPDGHRLIFSSNLEGQRNLYWQAADGSGTAERLTKSSNLQDATGVSPDGTRLVFTETTSTGADVMEMQLDGTHRVKPLVQTNFNERNAVISPNGRWLAYEANDFGQFEVFVQPYPTVDGGRRQISTGGGTRPLWAPVGQELFYLAPSGAMMRVALENGSSWAASIPTKIVNDGYFSFGTISNPGRTYDISPDGTRFLTPKRTDQTDAPVTIEVVQDFVGELKRLVSSK